VSFEPPLIGIAVHPARHTHDMIRYSEEFALNIPSRELLHHCQYLGSVTGREVNKLELTKLPTFRARHVDAPLLEGCVAYIECGVADAITTGDHTFFVGKVVAALDGGAGGGGPGGGGAGALGTARARGRGARAQAQGRAGLADDHTAGARQGAAVSWTHWKISMCERRMLLSR
jgi:hypothetical protein